MQLEAQSILVAIQVFFAVLVVLVLISAILAIKLWSRLPLDISNPNKKSRFHNITIVLPTWNEELLILSKLEDVLAQDYPMDKIEIIVIDAGSTDSTLEIVNEWKDNYDFSSGLSLKIIQEGKRVGKSVSINRAFSEAREASEILMMSDVDCRLSSEALKKISHNFSDPSIGAVTGKQVLLNESFSPATQFEGNYRDFYTKMRLAESKLDSTPIFHGECSAYRRESIKGYKIIESSNADDSQMAVITRVAGYRAIYDEEIRFYEMAPPNSRSTRVQKIRRAQGLSRHFWRNKGLITSKKIGSFRKILLLEFSLHILLPWFVFLGFLFGFLHIGSIIQSNYSELGNISISSQEQIILFIDVAVMLFLGFGKMHIEIPLARTVYTFYQYMLILLISHIKILSGISLHLWQQVPEVRESLKEYDELRRKEG